MEHPLRKALPRNCHPREEHALEQVFHQEMQYRPVLEQFLKNWSPREGPMLEQVRSLSKQEQQRLVLQTDCNPQSH